MEIPDEDWGVFDTLETEYIDEESTHQPVMRSESELRRFFIKIAYARSRSKQHKLIT